LGNSDLFRVSLYDFFNSPVKEPGDVPDEGKLQMVILSPRRTMLQGKLDSKLTDFMSGITENYGKRHRMNGIWCFSWRQMQEILPLPLNGRWIGWRLSTYSATPVC